MPNSNGNKKKSKELTRAVGAILAAPVVAPLIVLSGFVPMPLMIQSARAGSATLQLTGAFITGMSVVKKADMKFGKMVASAPNGKISITTAGAYANESKAVGISGVAAGKFTYKAATTKLAFDLTIKGIGKLTLAATVGGKGPVGTAKLVKILLGKAYAGAGASRTCTVTGAGTSCKEAFTGGADFTVKSGTVNMGGRITWGATAPIGAFGQTVTITQAF